MSDIDTFEVKTSDPSGVAVCKISVAYGPSITVTFVSADGDATTIVENDIFECMRTLRRRLEARSVLLLCNGARVDAYPSQIARQMGAARRVHITTLGRQGTRADLVDIFGEAPIDKVGSVQAQDAFHQEWLRSLGWDV